MPQYQPQMIWRAAIAVCTLLTIQPVMAEEAVLDLDKIHHNTPYVGTMSCAATSCHGAGFSEPDRVYRSYDIWRTKDPHAKAYQVLFNEVSVNMGKLLKLKTPPHQNETCLACHGNPPGYFEKSNKHDMLVTAQPTNGVGCESCHGGARNWLSEHRSYKWDSKSIEEKAAAGFVNLKNLTERAKVCADCHVGGPGKDVNHDLIGAGHPRLNFEFSAYMAKYASAAAHWSVNEDYARYQKENGSTYEAHAWLSGQIVSAQKAAALLKQRANNEKAPWPEFSEYSCYACHHDLSQPSFAGPNWRQVRAKSRDRMVMFPWNNWNHALAASAVESLKGQAAGQSLRTSMNALQAEMETFAASRSKVVGMAGNLENELAKFSSQIESQGISPADSRTLITGLTADGMVMQIKDWDRATQSYLALVALKNSMDGDANSLNSNLLDIRSNLFFPMTTTKEFQTIQFNSPKWDTEEKLKSIRMELKDIHKISMSN